MVSGVLPKREGRNLANWLAIVQIVQEQLRALTPLTVGSDSIFPTGAISTQRKSTTGITSPVQTTTMQTRGVLSIRSSAMARTGLNSSIRKRVTMIISCKWKWKVMIRSPALTPTKVRRPRLYSPRSRSRRSSLERLALQSDPHPRNPLRRHQAFFGRIPEKPRRAP